MLRSYFLFIWRNLVKDRQFTILNMIGLSIGLACAILIGLWIREEWQVDKFNEHDAQLYQVLQNIPEGDDIHTVEYTPALLAPALEDEFPEVESAATVLPASWFDTKGIVTIGNTRMEAGGQFVTPSFFRMFNCRMVKGKADQLFADRRYVSISDELAMKLFKSPGEAIGKTISWNQSEFSDEYIIVSVFQKWPSNATEHFDLIFNFELFKEKRPAMLSWDNSDPSTYVMLRKGADPGIFRHRILHFLSSRQQSDSRTLVVRRFSDKYLYGTYSNGKQAGGRIVYVRLFALIAFFILGIACINFVNLSTARASRRMKEVGIKKLVGASRSTLIIQYLGESMLLSGIALMIALIIVFLILPLFSQFTGKNLSPNGVQLLLPFAFGLTAITGLVAGIYPAFYLSRFRPSAVLKGRLPYSITELWFRKGLVVFQYSLSAVAIVAVLVIYRQMHYVDSRDLGYDRQNVIDFAIPMDLDSAGLSAAQSFVSRLTSIPGVLSAGSHYHNLYGEHGGISGFEWPGKDPGLNIHFANLEIGYGFMQTVGIKMKEGRYFRKGDDESRVIIFNESAINAMGIKDPVGKVVKYWGQEREIIGVARDFNFESLYHSVTPCFFRIYPVLPNVVVKIKPGTVKPTLEALTRRFAGFSKGLPFDYHFLDDQYDALYKSENLAARLAWYFAGLAVFISCLGLYGLSAFSTQRRRKEIGIRKVVGASSLGLTIMLGKEYLILIIISLLLAFPLAGWIMGKWLADFAYRVSLGWTVFLSATVCLLLITAITIGWKAMGAARANPVSSLRSE